MSDLEFMATLMAGFSTIMVTLGFIILKLNERPKAR